MPDQPDDAAGGKRQGERLEQRTAGDREADLVELEQGGGCIYRGLRNVGRRGERRFARLRALGTSWLAQAQ